MREGSLVELEKNPEPEDVVNSKAYGIPLPKKGEIYTVAGGPIKRDYGFGVIIPIILLMELGSNWYNADFFVEVQPPMDMKVFFEQLKEELV